jgi:integrase/recombinase XerD
MVLAWYARWLAAERGLAETTIRRNVELVRPFLAGWERAGRVQLGYLRAADVTAFVVARCQNARGGTAPRMVTALRSLLRFLHVEGLIEWPLASVVPSVATWTLAGLPKALQADQVAALLASCDRGTAVGRRDLAILTVLVRRGLRAGEAAALRLDDIDWRRGEITVHGKGNRHDRLPLPADVGQVIVAYLTARHPDTIAAGRQVFMRVRAPQQALTRGAVTQVVARAAQRAGLGPIHAHRLRHTAATGMLRGGGSLGGDRAGAAASPRAHHRDLRESRPRRAASAGPLLAQGCRMSPLEQALADYLRIRRALGFKLERAERLLAQFIAYLHDHNAEVPPSRMRWPGRGCPPMPRRAGGRTGC